MSETSLNFIQQHEPAWVYEWLHQVFAGSQQVPADFNWLGLAETATLRASALYEQNTLPDLAWAKVALAVYEFLIQENEANRIAFEYSTMNLRAHLIINLGNVPDDPLLDSEHIIRWFFQNLNMPYDEVKQKTLHWRTLPKEQMLELRQIKNRLSVIQSLHKHDLLSSTHERETLQAWLSLRELLP